jgi:transmembrane sensor
MNSGNFSNYQFEDLITDESFINYCLRSNPKDFVFWQNWIINHPERRILIEKSEYYVRNFSLGLPENEYQEELAKIRSYIEPDSETYSYPSLVRLLQWNNPLTIGRGKRKSVIQWALPALVIILVTGYFIVQRSVVAGSALVENFNNGNIPLVLTLSDGSVITLAPHSGLNYPRHFDPAVRKVFLNGEASFHVSADTAHPFKVYQDDLVATVLGTVFTIRKERKDSSMTVELIKGKLRVEIIDGASSPVQSIMLLPNERVVYTKYNQKLLKEKWELDKDPTLQQISRLVFRKDDFNAVAIKIKAASGITLINHAEKKAWRFTGEFTNSTAGEIVTSICKIEGLTCEMVGDTILIK